MSNKLSMTGWPPTNVEIEYMKQVVVIPAKAGIQDNSKQ